MLPPSDREKYYRKLTLRNTLVSIILFLSPFLLLFFIVNQQTSSLIKNQVYSRLSDTIEENAKTIHIFLEDRKIDLKSYAKLDIDRIEEVSRYRTWLSSLVQEKRWYDFLIIADLEGHNVLSINQDITANIADRAYFRAAREGRLFYSGIFYSAIIKKPVMILSHPLKNRTNQTIGVLAASLDLENFYDLLHDLRMGRTSELFLVDGQGTLLSPTKLGGRPLADKGFNAQEANPHTGESGVKTHMDYRQQKVLCAYKKIPELNFYLVSEMDLEEALLPVKEVNRIILYVFLPFFLLLIVMSNLNSRRITGLVRSLTQNLQKALHEAREKKQEVDNINIELQQQIKESQQLAHNLSLSEEYIRNLIDSISLAVIGLDCTGMITHLNREVRILFGLQELQTGEELFRALPCLDDKEIREAFIKAVEHRQPQRCEEKAIGLDRGEENFNLSFFPILKEDGDIRGVTLLVENVTERIRLRQQLAEYEKLSAISQLAMGAAHEINNPLLGISSYLENLKEESRDAEDKEEIEFVLENVYRISETIRGLLNFARPTPPQFTKVNINQLIDETLSFLSHQPIFRKTKIKKNLPAALPPITADLNQIRQVLINMFLNAAQSMPRGGELAVQTSKVKFKEFIQIDIADSGSGIPPENQKKIFNPFYTTKKSQGTGLGLSISLSYIKNHHGDIAVKSEVNKGTTFSIFFPIRQRGRAPLRDEETIT